MVSHLTGWSTTPKKLSPQNEDAQLKIFQTFFLVQYPHYLRRQEMIVSSFIAQFFILMARLQVMPCCTFPNKYILNDDSIPIDRTNQKEMRREVQIKTITNLKLFQISDYNLFGFTYKIVMLNRTQPILALVQIFILIFKAWQYFKEEGRRSLRFEELL